MGAAQVNHKSRWGLENVSKSHSCKAALRATIRDSWARGAGFTSSQMGTQLLHFPRTSERQHLGWVLLPREDPKPRGLKAHQRLSQPQAHLPLHSNRPANLYHRTRQPPEMWRQTSAFLCHPSSSSGQLQHPPHGTLPSPPLQQRARRRAVHLTHSCRVHREVLFWGRIWS